MIIDVPDIGEKLFFECNKWFDLRKDEKIIVRELSLTDFQEYPVRKNSNKMSPRNNVYIVHVETSDIAFAGTNAKVFLQIFGEKNKDSGRDSG